jgi:hypothetical protein
MADIPQVLATYDALVGVALGAGLTYAFGALSRRHQEAREDKTRWYETRLKAYAELTQTVSHLGLAHEAKHEKLRRESGSQGKGRFRAWTGGRRYSPCWLVRSRGQS